MIDRDAPGQDTLELGTRTATAVIPAAQSRLGLLDASGPTVFGRFRPRLHRKSFSSRDEKRSTCQASGGVDRESPVPMTPQVPDGTPARAVDDIRAREAAHSRDLAAAGYLLRLW